MGNWPDVEEQARLAALAAPNLIDSNPGGRFDRIVEFAAREFSAPNALLTLISASRQWSKARFGITFCETPCENSICPYTIQNDGSFVHRNAQRYALYP